METETKNKIRKNKNREQTAKWLQWLQAFLFLHLPRQPAKLNPPHRVVLGGTARFPPLTRTFWLNMRRDIYGKLTCQMTKDLRQLVKVAKSFVSVGYELIEYKQKE